MQVEITAVICTHNRAGPLHDAIESLLNQSLSTSDYEIVVVDNCSADETAAVLRHYVETAKTVRLRSFRLDTLGLSHARNLAIHEACGRIIAFLDDDAIASPQWLQTLLAAYAAFPSAWALGGKVILRWQAARPEWLTDNLLPSLSMLDLGDKALILGDHEFLIGANFSFLRKVFVKAGMFRTDLGRRKRYLLGGEDTEIQKRIRNLGQHIGYIPDAQVYHQVGPDRLRRLYFVRHAYDQGRSHARIAAAEHGYWTLCGRIVRSGAGTAWKCLSLIASPFGNWWHCPRLVARWLGYVRETIIFGYKHLRTLR